MSERARARARAEDAENYSTKRRHEVVRRRRRRAAAFANGIRARCVPDAPQANIHRRRPIGMYTSANVSVGDRVSRVSLRVFGAPARARSYRPAHYVACAHGHGRT